MIAASAYRKVRNYYAMSIKLYKVAISSPVNRFPSPVPRIILYCMRNLSHHAQSRCTYAHSAHIKESRFHSSIVHHRISRVNRTEAEEVLSEYLHSTRGFLYSDAEHISKNCPLFIEQLISFVDKSNDLKKSMRKYLSYNPINEFEPFLESIGLKPSDISKLLPRDQIFLSDDPLLMDNYHVLCNYGFPRSDLGKMISQAREIFNSDPGVIESKLRAYTLLGLRRSAVIKLVMCSPSLLTEEVNKHCIDVVQKLKKLGFADDWTLKYLFFDEIYDWKKMAETLEFLEGLGYSEENLQGFIKKALLKDAEGNIIPVIHELVRTGFDRNKIHSLFMESPVIFSPKGAKNLVPAIRILQKIGFQFDFLEQFISNNVDNLCARSFKSPRRVSQEQKMKKSEIFRLIARNPENFISLFTKVEGNPKKSSLAEDSARDLDKKAFLLRLGYTVNTDEMRIASRVFRGRGDELEERFNCLIEAGLDFNGAKSLVRNAPQVLNQKKDVLQKKIECLRYGLGYPIDSLVMFPAFLGYSLDRITRRISMFVWLRDKGVVKPTLSISSILVCSEPRFFKYFVLLHPDGLSYWYHLSSSSTVDKE